MHHHMYMLVHVHSDLSYMLVTCVYMLVTCVYMLVAGVYIQLVHVHVCPCQCISELYMAVSCTCMYKVP